MIVPYERRESIIQAALETDLHLSRITDVKGNIRTEPKRTLLEFSPLTCTSPQENILTLELSPGTYTEEYLKLGHDFYLKF